MKRMTKKNEEEEEDGEYGERKRAHIEKKTLNSTSRWVCCSIECAIYKITHSHTRQYCVESVEVN